jgi:smad nuclear-interacting protein 1
LKRYGQKADREPEPGIREKRLNSRERSGSRHAESIAKEDAVKEKKKPCFVPTGILASFSNKLNGVT